MANQANIKAVITADDRASKVLNSFGDNVDKQAQRATDGFDRFTSRIAIGATIAGVATNAISKGISLITDSIGDAVKRVDTLNNSNRAFQNMGFTATQVKVSMDALTKSVLGLPTSLDDAVRNVQLLAASTNDLGKSQKLFKALNDGILGFGGSAEQVDTAVIQLSQAFAGGRVYAQDWNSMLNAGLGPALNAIAKQMHITTSALKDGLGDGSISVDKFQTALINLDEKGGGGMASLSKIVKDATSGIGTGFANMQVGITRGVASIIKALGPENISGAISNFGSSIEGMLKTTAEYVPKIAAGLSRISDYLSPKLEALGRTIRNDVLPPVLDLAKAFGPVIGAGLVWALGVVIDSLKIFLDAVTPFLNFLKDNTWIVYAFAAAFVTIKTALFIEKAVAAFQVSLLVLEGAMAQTGGVAAGLRVLLLGILGPWQIILAIVGVAAVLEGINLVSDKLDEVFNKWNRNSKVGLPNSNIKVGGNSPTGLVSQLRQAFGGFASGGYTGAGASNEVAGIVHRGEYVLPQNMVDQSTGMPKSGGGTININVNAGVFMGSDVEARKVANIIAGHLKDIAAAKSMTVSQMVG